MFTNQSVGVGFPNPLGEGTSTLQLARRVGRALAKPNNLLEIHQGRCSIVKRLMTSLLIVKKDNQVIVSIRFRVSVNLGLF